MHLSKPRKFLATLSALGFVSLLHAGGALDATAAAPAEEARLSLNSLERCPTRRPTAPHSAS